VIGVLEDDPIVRPGGGQGRAVGRERQRDVAQQAAWRDDLAQFLNGVRVPDPDVAVVCRGDAAALAAESSSMMFITIVRSKS
jgi:type IV secretory pathway TrbF-like protein